MVKTLAITKATAQATATDKPSHTVDMVAVVAVATEATVATAATEASAASNSMAAMAAMEKAVVVARVKAEEEVDMVVDGEESEAYA